MLHRLAAAVLLIISAVSLNACHEKSGPDNSVDSANGSSSKAIFADASTEIDLDFIDQLRLTGTYALYEITGTGMAVFDANNDQRLDFLCLQNGSLAEGKPDRLFLQGENGKLKDVSADSEFASTFSTGCAVGDVDNDGDVDIYVGTIGMDHIYLNDGNGKFRDASAEMGLVNNGFTTSLAFLDFDLDGYLDIFVFRCSVLQEPAPKCLLVSDVQEFCHPRQYQKINSQLWRNIGGKTFQNVSQSSGIAAKKSYGLGVIVDDFNNDGWPDLYVANDSVPNFLWVNNKKGGFKEVGLMSGTAVNSQGASEGSMGLAVGDIDGNGFPDIFTTNVRSESNTLYFGNKGLDFSDGTAVAGLAASSLPYTGWGTAFFDPDNDSDFDLILVNGSVARNTPPFPGSKKGSVWEHYSEGNLFFENIGNGQLSLNPDMAKAPCSWVANHRSMVAVDFDGDGGEDVFIDAMSDETRFFRNVAEDRGHWIKVEVYDDEYNRYAMGAVVRIYSGDLMLRGIVNSATSYLSSCLAPLKFGLGKRMQVDRVEVTFPGGEVQTFAGGKHGETLVLRRQRK
ncbi:MAG: hypothetical protein ACI97A_000877 [Planctomycetota bacterium]|jgi:hypothetical protein